MSKCTLDQLCPKAMKDERGPHIDAATFARLLREFGPHLVCSRVGLHYGSMLYFDMGALKKIRLRSGTSAYEGEAYLVLDGYNWAIRDGEWTLATSETVTRGIAESLIASRFVGRKLERIDFTDQSLSAERDVGVAIAFADAPLIELWTVRSEEEYIDDELFELRLPNGQWICGWSDRRLTLSYEGHRH